MLRARSVTRFPECWNPTTKSGCRFQIDQFIEQDVLCEIWQWRKLWNVSLHETVRAEDVFSTTQLEHTDIPESQVQELFQMQGGDGELVMQSAETQDAKVMVITHEDPTFATKTLHYSYYSRKSLCRMDTRNIDRGTRS